MHIDSNDSSTLRRFQTRASGLRAWCLAAGMLVAAWTSTSEAAQIADPRPYPSSHASFDAPADAAPKTKKPRKSARTELKGQLNIHTATAEQWTLLPGIGNSTAAKIVAERDKQAFSSLEDLTRVRGIGTKTLARIRAHLKLEGESDLQRVAAGAS